MARMVGVGDQVRVASGPHEGRSGTITGIRPVQVGYGDPEPYAIVQISVKDATDKLVDDFISVPMRRLA